MPDRPLFYETGAVAGSPAAAAETVIAVLEGVTIEGGPRDVHLSGWANIGPDAAATSAAFAVRRDGLTGVQVGATVFVGVSAGVQAEITTHVTDVLDDSPGATYVLTLRMVAAVAPSTVDAVDLTARVD